MRFVGFFVDVEPPTLSKNAAFVACEFALSIVTYLNGSHLWLRNNYYFDRKPSENVSQKKENNIQSLACILVDAHATAVCRVPSASSPRAAST